MEKIKIKPKEFLYLSNLLSISRIFMVIPFLFFVHYGIAENNAILFILALLMLFLAVLSDVLDGHVARRLNQVSELGKALDPIADKIVTFIGGFSLVIYLGLPAWLFIIMVSRDILIFVGGVVQAKRHNYVFMANIYGKVNTVLSAFMALVLIIRTALPIFAEYYDFNYPERTRHSMDIMRVVVLYILLASNIVSFFSYAKMYFDIERGARKT